MPTCISRGFITSCGDFDESISNFVPQYRQFRPLCSPELWLDSLSLLIPSSSRPQRSTGRLIFPPLIPRSPELPCPSAQCYRALTRHSGITMPYPRVRACAICAPRLESGTWSSSCSHDACLAELCSCPTLRSRPAFRGPRHFPTHPRTSVCRNNPPSEPHAIARTVRPLLANDEAFAARTCTTCEGGVGRR
jgi:hypothetical protein